MASHSARADGQTGDPGARLPAIRGLFASLGRLLAEIDRLNRG